MTDRRSFLRGASVLMGHAAFGQVMTAFAAAPRKASFFTDAEMTTLRALVDVILPATDSPAASAADTHYFIDLAIPACASAAAQKTFRGGPRARSGRRNSRVSRRRTQVALLEGARGGGHAAAVRPVVLQDSQGLHAHRLFPLRGRRHAGAGLRTSARRFPGRSAARAQPESVGDLMAASNQFDAIVVGSGMSGGWAAKELTEKGLKTLVLERGRNIRHVADYTDRAQGPMAAAAQQSRHQRGSRGAADPVDALSIRPVDQAAFRQRPRHPYEQAQPFNWYRGYHVGGRSLMWARHVFRYSDLDFEANLREGVGIDWPIRYADIAPWYEHVERFIGASGENSGLPQLPEQVLQPPFEMNALEKHIRGHMAATVRRRAQAHLQRHGRAVARAQRPRPLPGAQSMRARLSVQRVFLLERRHAARRGGHRQSHAAAGCRGAFADLR